MASCLHTLSHFDRVPSYLTLQRPDRIRRPHLGRLRAIVRSRMWKWLFDAHRLLGVTIEVLDDEFAVLAPSRDGRALRERFEASRSAPLQSVLAASVVGDAPFLVAGGDVQLACAPIVGASALAGAVLVGTSGRTRLEDGDLARLGSLLSDAIGDQLARPAQEHRGNLHQISALYELLNAAIASGSETEVVRTFAEALSIWEEIEVLAYRADLDGRYTLTLALPGSDPAAVPRLLEHEHVVEAPSVRRLSPVERQNLGFSGDGETVLALLRSDGGQWAIALNAAHAAADGERSEMYVAALGHALNGGVAVATSRLTWAVMQRFVERDPPIDAARRALDELGRALGADGTFVVRAPAGLRVLSVGNLAPTGTGPVATARTLRSDVPAPPPFSAVMEMHARPGQSFTPRDAKLFDAAVAGFGAWLPAALRRIGVAERRGVARSFDQIVDRYAREAHEARDDASLILISAGDDMPSLETTHAWIKRVRPQLRPTDLAGRLASGELGILLLQTPHAGAEIVARRLTRVLAKAPASGERAVLIGVASQDTELVTAEALIASARRQASCQPLSAS